MKRGIYIFLAVLTLLFSCHHAGEKQGAIALRNDDGEVLRYARRFTLQRADAYTVLSILSPGSEGHILQRFTLKKRGVKLPVGFKIQGTLLEVPLKRLAVSSLDNLGYLSLLGALDRLVAVSDEDRIYNPAVREALEKGRVKSLGPAVNIDRERLLMLKPDLLIATRYERGVTADTKLMGIPVLYNLDWLEDTPLGRAEWIKLTGALLDKDAEADSIFLAIESRYKALKAKAMQHAEHPKVMSGAPYKGLWYVPGNKSFKARLYRDAGASYYLPGDSSTASVALSLEQALLRFAQAEVWFEAPYHSLAELRAADSRLTAFKPFHNGRVYNVFARSRGPANDYWEQGLCRPDLLLADIISVLYSDSGEFPLTFYKKLIQDDQ